MTNQLQLINIIIIIIISPNIFRMMKLMRMNWAGHVARMSSERDTIILYILRKTTHFSCEMTLTLFYLSHGCYIQFWYSDAQAFCYLQGLHELHVLHYALYSCNKIYAFEIVKYSLSESDFHCREYDKVCWREFREKTWLICTTQPFGGQFPDAISRLKLLAVTESRLFFV